MFHFGSSRLFQHVFNEFEPNSVETVGFVETNVEINDETTDSDSFCLVMNLVKKIMAHLDTWIVRTMKGGQVQIKLSGKTLVTGRLWTLVLGWCVVSPSGGLDRRWHWWQCATWWWASGRWGLWSWFPITGQFWRFGRLGTPWTWFVRTPRRPRWTWRIWFGAYCAWTRGWTS